MYKRHGQHKTRAYRVWIGMKGRCKNPNYRMFKDYGGRGIAVCDSWEDFEVFLNDMGQPPEGHSLDRIDNNKGYSKENCRWATSAQQMTNTRWNRHVEFNGRSMPISHWERELGLWHGTINERLKRGWPLEKALTPPLPKGVQTYHPDAKIIEFRGEKKCMKDWERALGLGQGMVGRRLKNGWTVEKALTTPPGAGNFHRRAGRFSKKIKVAL